MKQKTITAFTEEDFDDKVNSFRLMPGIEVRFSQTHITCVPSKRHTKKYIDNTAETDCENDLVYTCVMLYDGKVEQ